MPVLFFFILISDVVFDSLYRILNKDLIIINLPELPDNVHLLIR